MTTKVSSVLYLLAYGVSFSGAFAPGVSRFTSPRTLGWRKQMVATPAAGDSSTSNDATKDDNAVDDSTVVAVNATTAATAGGNTTATNDVLGSLGQWLNEVQESNDNVLNEWNAAFAEVRKPPTLGAEFPNLVGSTQSTDSFDLFEYLGDSWGVVFMHPGDFTPVCSTELGRAAELENEFEARNAKLCGFSCNDRDSHIGWIEDIKSVTGSQVQFPLFCDPDRSAAVALGILDQSNKDAKGLPLTVRSVYILRPDKTIALMITYPASTGRNFDEILRALDSLQLTTDYAVATPVDWKKGEEVIVNFPLSNEEATAKFGEDGYRVVDVPSEHGKELDKNYLRYTKDPSKPTRSGLRNVLSKIPLLKRL